LRTKTYTWGGESDYSNSDFLIAIEAGLDFVFHLSPVLTLAPGASVAYNDEEDYTITASIGFVERD
jgi:hypothetical protein